MSLNSNHCLSSYHHSYHLLKTKGVMVIFCVKCETISFTTAPFETWERFVSARKQGIFFIRDAQTNSMVCYATTVYFNTAVFFSPLLYLFQLDLLQYFKAQLIQISVVQSQVVPSGLQETLGPLLISLISSAVNHLFPLSATQTVYKISRFHHRV